MLSLMKWESSSSTSPAKRATLSVEQPGNSELSPPQANLLSSLSEIRAESWKRILTLRLTKKYKQKKINWSPFLRKIFPWKRKTRRPNKIPTRIPIRSQIPQTKLSIRVTQSCSKMSSTIILSTSLIPQPVGTTRWMDFVCLPCSHTRNVSSRAHLCTITCNDWYLFSLLYLAHSLLSRI